MKPGQLPPNCTPREALYFAETWRADAIRRRRTLRLYLIAAIVAACLGALTWALLQPEPSGWCAHDWQQHAGLMCGGEGL